MDAPTRSAISAPAVAGSCGRCGAEVKASEHFCGACGAVQPPTATDHFAFFGSPRKLDLDVAKLEKEFYRLSRRLHPDVCANATAHEQQWSLEKSSQLNDAYRTLKDAVARTQYLLGLEGVQLEEQSKAATERARQTGEEKKQALPPDLLEEVFELNMQLQELKASGGKDPGAAAQLETAKKGFEERLETMSLELKHLWQEWDSAMDAGDDGRRVEVRDKMVGLLNRRSYIRNLVRDVKEALAD